MLKSFFSRSHELLTIIIFLISAFLFAKSVNVSVGIAGNLSDFWYYCIPGVFTLSLALTLFLHAELIENSEAGSNGKNLEKPEKLGNDLVANQNKSEDTDTVSVLPFCEGGMRKLENENQNEYFNVWDLLSFHAYRLRFIIGSILIALSLMGAIFCIKATIKVGFFSCVAIYTILAPLFMIFELIVIVASLYEASEDPKWKISVEDFYPDYWDHLMKIINADKMYKAHKYASQYLDLILKHESCFIFCSDGMREMDADNLGKLFDIMTIYKPDIFTDGFINRVVTDLTNNYKGTYTISDVGSEKGSYEVTVNLENIAGENHNYTFITK